MDHMRRKSSSKLNPVRRVVSSSKREVVLTGTKRSRPSSEESNDLNHILTSQPSRKSSRPNSQPKEDPMPKDPPISDTQFYLNSSAKLPKPKSFLEKSYEAKLQKFLLTDESDEFLALELETKVTSSLPPSLVGSMVKSEEAAQEPPEEETTIEAEVEEEVTPDSVLKLTENPDFVCQWLLRTADTFIEEAHGYVLAANYIEGVKVYYKLVKAAMKALHLVISRYMACLKPVEAALVLYKLAQIYLDETDNYNTAEELAKGSLATASKNGILLARVAAELLCAKILKASDVHLVGPFLNERQEIYERESKKEISTLFALQRIGMAPLSDIPSLIPALNTAWQSLDGQVRCLCLLLLSRIYLSQGSPKEAENALHECRVTFFKMKLVLPQLKAMLYLQNLAVCTQTNDFKHSKKWIRKLTEFVKKQKEEKWASWRSDGTIPIEIQSNNETVTFLLQWIGPDEFVPTFYLTSGVHFMTDSSELTKASQIFEKCLRDVENAITALTTYLANQEQFGVSHLTTKIVRLSVIKFTVLYYQVWLKFMLSSDFDGIQVIHAFLESYNEKNFTAEELWYYKFLIPHLTYLSAIYHQSQGNLKAAKYHFLRVRSLVTQSCNIPIEAFNLQHSLGVGYETSSGRGNELYIYSTMHLLNIAEYEFRTLSQINQHEQTIKSSRSLLASLHADMTSILEDPNTAGITSTNTFKLTYKSALAAFNNGSNHHDSALSTEIERLVFSDTIRIHNMELLGLYLLLRLAVNLDQSNRLYGKCTRRITKAEDNGKILSLFVYLEAQRRELGDTAKAEKIQRKIDAIKHSVQSKIDAARQSLQPRSSDRDI